MKTTMMARVLIILIVSLFTAFAVQFIVGQTTEDAAKPVAAQQKDPVKTVA